MIANVASLIEQDEEYKAYRPTFSEVIGHLIQDREAL